MWLTKWLDPTFYLLKETTKKALKHIFQKKRDNSATASIMVSVSALFTNLLPYSTWPLDVPGLSSCVRMHLLTCSSFPSSASWHLLQPCFTSQPPHDPLSLCVSLCAVHVVDSCCLCVGFCCLLSPDCLPICLFKPGSHLSIQVDSLHQSAPGSSLWNLFAYVLRVWGSFFNISASQNSSLS